jgi:hypothetical protein
MRRTVLAVAIIATLSTIVAAAETSSAPSAPPAKSPTAKMPNVIARSVRASMAVECEAVADADVMYGNYTNGASQRFKVLGVLAGKAEVGSEIVIRYVFVGAERPVPKGERVVWTLRSEPNGYRGGGPYPATDEGRAVAREAATWVFYITNDNCPDYTWGFSEAETRQAYADIVAAHLDEMTRTDDRPADSRDRYNMAVTNEALCFVEKSPKRKDELVRRIKEGRVFVSPFLCNTLWGFQSTEGVIRSLYPARRLERDWGIPKIEWAEHIELPSLPWGMAPILTGCGVRWLSVPFYNYDSTFKSLENPERFYFEGPEGSLLRVVMDPWACNKASYTQGADILRDPAKSTAEWMDYYLSLRLYCGRSILASGTHGDINPSSGKQAREFSDKIFKFNSDAKTESARLVNATLPMFCQATEDAIKAGSTSLPIVQGDFGHSWDCWPVSLAKYAAAMREGERQFLAAETLLTLAGREKPELYKKTQADRERAEWCWAMLADHAWNGTDDRNRKVNADLRKSWAADLSRIADAIRTDLAPPVTAKDSTDKVHLINTLGQPRQGLVRHAMPMINIAMGGLPAGAETVDLQMATENGQRIMYYVSPVVGGFERKVFRIPAMVGGSGDKLKIDPDGIQGDRNGPRTLESPFYKLTVDPKTGGISSAIYKPTGAELVASKAGRTLGQTVFFDGKEAALENLKFEWDDCGAVFVRLKSTGTVAGLKVTNLVTVYAALDRVDFEVQVSGKIPTKESRLVQFFPITKDGATLRAEMPGAVIRPRLQPEGDMLTGADRNRLCVQGFIDASTDAGGTTVAPLDAFLLRLDLGDPAFECLGNDQNYKEVSKDQGGETEFRFRYSLCGHKGPYNQAETVAWSRDVATPLIVTPAPDGADKADAEAAKPPVWVNPAQAIVLCLKPPDDGSAGCVFRLWGARSRGGPLTVRVNGYTRAVLVDLLERDIDQLSVINGRINVPMRDYGFAAVKLMP